MGGLHLTALTLSHFRSYRRARLQSDGRSLAIFGPNGAGKTNILEAVSLFSPGRGLRRATSEELALKPEALGWKIAGDIHGPERNHQVVLRAETGTARTVRIDGKTAPQMALGRLLRVLWLVPAMDRLWIEGAEGRRRFLDRMTLSFRPDHAGAVLTYEKSMRERNRLLKSQIDDTRWYGALEAQMAASGAVIQSNRAKALDRIAAAQAETETVFPTADLEMTDGNGAPVPSDEETLVETFARNRERDLFAGRTLIGPHRVDLGAVYAAKGVMAKQCSTGEQKALLISLILANARALTTEVGTAPILLLDEVAAHLDKGRRTALYDEIWALGAQAWMTGTEPELFDTLGDWAARVRVTETEGISRMEILE
ncbi:MAG: DNA replication/repair protein RecF [Pseudomonadota bacterium]